MAPASARPGLRVSLETGITSFWSKINRDGNIMLLRTALYFEPIRKALAH